MANTLRHCVEASGTTTSTGFVATGGGARSSLWRQILADTLNAPVRYLDGIEYGLLGADAAGIRNTYEPMETAKGSVIAMPNPHNVEICDRAHGAFSRSRAALSDTWS